MLLTAFFRPHHWHLLIPWWWAVCPAERHTEICPPGSAKAACRPVWMFSPCLLWSHLPCWPWLPRRKRWGSGKPNKKFFRRKPVAMGTGCQTVFCAGGVKSGATAFPKHCLLFSLVFYKNNEWLERQLRRKVLLCQKCTLRDSQGLKVWPVLMDPSNCSA